MRIQSIQNYSYNKTNPNPQFKSAFPVTHWVAETNGSYAPALSLKLNKKLQRILIGILNKTSRTDKGPVADKAIGYLKSTDKSYGFNPIARSYYDREAEKRAAIPQHSYIITGDDVQEFNTRFGEDIGRSKSYSPVVGGVRTSAELNTARANYDLLGFNFIKKKGRRIFDKKGMEYGLHTKFETIRTKTGRIKEYRLVDIKFCPESGPENPFVRVGLVKE